jgi:HK97 gp10 family phage protein
MTKRMVVRVEGLDQAIRELERRGANVQRALESIAHAGAQEMLEEARSRAPESIGAGLDAQTTRNTPGLVQVSVGPADKRTKKLAKLFERGTRPHQIAARKKRMAAARKLGKSAALSIPGIGYRRRVHHPGMKARPFMRPAFRAGIDDATSAMRREVAEAAEV